MLYLIVFTVVTGTLASTACRWMYKKHLTKNGVLQEKSWIRNAPSVLGSLHLVLVLVLGIWFMVEPAAFSKNARIIDNTLVWVLMSILSVYFYILALPLSIGAITLSVLSKPRISQAVYTYGITTNTIAAILLFLLSYLILSQ